MYTSYRFIIISVICCVLVTNLMPICCDDVTDPRIDVRVYFESLCPFSKNFVINQVVPAWNRLSRIMNLRLIPFGNSYIKITNENPPEYEFECQHGLKECIGNSIMSCGLSQWSQEKGIPYIDCIFQHTYWYKPKVAAYECASKLGLDWEKTCDCYTSKQGSILQLQMGNETRHLSPPHTYVPWITFNGEHNKNTQKSAMKNMIKVLCEMYKGPKIPQCP